MTEPEQIEQEAATIAASNLHGEGKAYNALKLVERLAREMRRDREEMVTRMTSKSLIEGR